jgi:hypothetical protein
MWFQPCCHGSRFVWRLKDGDEGRVHEEEAEEEEAEKDLNAYRYYDLANYISIFY